MTKEDLLEKLEEVTDALDGLRDMIESAKKENEEERSTFCMGLASAAQLLRAGFGGIFRVGDVIVDVGRTAWTVIGKEMDKDPENPERPTLTLFMRDVLPGRWQYSNPTPEHRWGHAHWPSSTIRKSLNEAFLSGFTEEEQAAMIAVDKVTYTVDNEGGKPETTRDKLFLLSCTEVGIPSGEYIRDEGAAYPYFAGRESRQKTDREGTARHWWLRSPNPSYASDVRYVHSDGSLYYVNAYDGDSAAAACVIG